MELKTLKGKYVIAVSGGVDSVVLLDLLSNQCLKTGNPELVVAHFDHGIRQQSTTDRKFVQHLSTKYSLPFFYSKGNLGSGASEQTARNARYAFLKKIVKQQSAKGLITAHHQDDQLETAILNIIRGTGRKGLASLNSNKAVIRPLLNYSKSELINYAKDSSLVWHEDHTNIDPKYLRNYIRHKIVPKLDSKSKQSLISLIKKQAVINTEIDKQLATMLKLNTSVNNLPRLWLNSLDNFLSKELLAAWLRQNGLAEFDRPTINRLATQTKTIGSGKKIDLFKGWQLIISKDNLALERVER